MCKELHNCCLLISGSNWECITVFPFCIEFYHAAAADFCHFHFIYHRPDKVICKAVFAALSVIFPEFFAHPVSVIYGYWSKCYHIIFLILFSSSILYPRLSNSAPAINYLKHIFKFIVKKCLRHSQLP